MAAVRPNVTVTQTFATQSFTPDVPDLNTLLVGPAYHIMDYPADKDDIEVTSFGVKNAASDATGAPAGAPSAPIVVSLPGNVVGATLVANSVKVYLEDIYARVVAGADAAATDQTQVLTVADSSDVLPGDRVVLTGVDAAANVVTIEKVVDSVPDGTSIKMTSLFSLNGTDINGNAYTGLVLGLASLDYRVERAMDDQELAAEYVTASAVDGTVSISNTALVETLPIDYAQMFVQYMTLRQDLHDVTEVSSSAAITSLLGKLDERNPLAVGAHVALQNTTTPVKVLGIQADSPVGYTTALDLIESREDVYCLVPLTSNVTTIAAFKASVEALADPEISNFRIVIGSSVLPTSKTVVDSSTGDYDIATRVLTDVGATFVASGVIATDSVVMDDTSYVVESVTNENQLVLVAGPALGGEVTYTVTRALDKAGQVTELNAIPASLNSSRVFMVYPDECYVGGVKNESTGLQSKLPAYYVSCAVGGMVAGYSPHQNFSNLALAGISQVFNSSRYFSRTQIDALSNAGWYVILQDTISSLPYCVHSLSTDTQTLESGELMVVKNFDYVAIFFKNLLRGFLKGYNVVPETINLIEDAMSGGVRYLTGRRKAKIGAPLLSATIGLISVVAGQADQVQVAMSIQLPRPLNQLHLILTA